MTGSCKLVTNLFPPPRVCPYGQVEIGAAFQFNSHRTKQHFCKPLQADPQTKVCKKAVFSRPTLCLLSGISKKKYYFRENINKLT
jgi:hypothetical protein